MPISSQLAPTLQKVTFVKMRFLAVCTALAAATALTGCSQLAGSGEGRRR